MMKGLFLLAFALISAIGVAQPARRGLKLRSDNACIEVRIIMRMQSNNLLMFLG